MKIYRKPDFADSTGDAVPFYHDGQYHLFTLTPPKGTTVYPARLRTTWEHAVSDDLINWKQLPTALYPSDDESAPDASGIWTGSVIYGEGGYHAFYTGYSLKVKYQQTICHAYSDDGVKWQKDINNPVIIPKTDEYEPLDWRDPYVFYNEDDKCYWILISARKTQGAPNRRGSVVLYRSHDLKNWEYYGPIYSPGHTNCPECPEMYKIGDTWYLSYSRFSEYVNTIYRVSKSPFGPWRTPKNDGIGGRRFYAAKSMVNNDGRRFYFGWAHDRADRSDYGQWYWGGAFCVPHEVVAVADGELAVKLPLEYEQAANAPVAWRFEPVSGDISEKDGKITVNSVATNAYGFFDINEPSFIFSCNITPDDCRDYFGLLIKSDKDAETCCVLQFDTAAQRVSLSSLPMAVDPFWQQSCQAIPKPTDPGPDGVRVAEHPMTFKSGDTIGVKILIDRDMIEVFVDEKIAFTYRIYRECDYQLGVIVQDGNAHFTDIKITK
ncbi:MAG: family 43 glycosylhydrolase [Clostridia bacterium]|nr:family 43 glycosylhydrolase [Clostridia bacterium]